MVEGEMSVVQVALPAQPTGGTEYTMNVPAGPPLNNDDAKAKCPAICASYGGTWNGQWTTVVEGEAERRRCTFSVLTDPPAGTIICAITLPGPSSPEVRTSWVLNPLLVQVQAFRMVPTHPAADITSDT